MPRAGQARHLRGCSQRRAKGRGCTPIPTWMRGLPRMNAPGKAPCRASPAPTGVFAAARERPRMHTDIQMDAGLATHERTRQGPVPGKPGTYGGVRGGARRAADAHRYPHGCGACPACNAPGKAPCRASPAPTGVFAAACEGPNMHNDIPVDAGLAPHATHGNAPCRASPAPTMVFAAAREGPQMHTDIPVDAGLAPHERPRQRPVPGEPGTYGVFAAALEGRRCTPIPTWMRGLPRMNAPGNTLCRASPAPTAAAGGC